MPELSINAGIGTGFVFVAIDAGQKLHNTSQPDRARTLDANPLAEQKYRSIGRVMLRAWPPESQAARDVFSPIQSVEEGVFDDLRHEGLQLLDRCGSPVCGNHAQLGRLGLCAAGLEPT